MADPDAAEGTKMVSRIAIVRGVPDSFCDALSMTPPPQPVDLERARLQHAVYVDVLKDLVQEVIELPADNKYPDCPFIEDTAVVIGNRALITHPGAASRQGEEEAIREALKQLRIHISEVEPPGLIDGGDVLYASGMLFAGNSSRTNVAGIESLQKAFPDVRVHTIRVGEGLHLKSGTTIRPHVVVFLDTYPTVVSFSFSIFVMCSRVLFSAISSISPKILAVEDSPAAIAMFDEIQQKTDGHFKMVKTLGPGAANTVLVGDAVICSATLGLGSLKLEAHYKQHARHVIPVDISEFHKVDGGLTCLSLLIER
ncbi:hypothetical protein M758_7G182600 [Ceratodon purpureus]|nr:hypothetical protein M758_7G182600 [Ceratodon purpureus]